MYFFGSINATSINGFALYVGREMNYNMMINV